MAKRPRDPTDDPTRAFHEGAYEEMDSRQIFSSRNKHHQANKTAKTSARREESEQTDTSTLPLGRVMQVYSRYCEVDLAGVMHRATVRKTLTKVTDGGPIVGDWVRLRPAPAADATVPRATSTDPLAIASMAEARARDDAADPAVTAADVARMPAAVVESVEPRRTVLTRSDSFKSITNHPIVANADRMLIVVSITLPDVKWGLVDRMLVAARAGGLMPILALNKVDLVDPAGLPLAEARAILAHYATELGVKCVECSANTGVGIATLREMLAGVETVLAGHSGVGKSSLIRVIEPGLDLRVGDISHFTDKGRHTTTSARRYPLAGGGVVIDTPGVKLFGLWGVTRETLAEHFPDVEEGRAPAWRTDSYERILESLPAE